MKINMQETSDEEFCRTSYAAKLLNLSIGTVQTLVKKNELRAWKTDGGHRRISLPSILEYQKQHSLKPQTDLVPAPAPAAQPMMLKVLVVEDDAPTRELLQGTMAQWNLPLDIIMMASAMEALIAISSLRPDVLITDLKMPGVDGFELLRTLRANPAFADIHLVAITSLNESAITERGGLPEYTAYLKKPADINWLNGYFVALVAAQRGRRNPG